MQVSRYPTDIVLPMKAELTSKGFAELLTTESVDQALSSKGTQLVAINSICGCSAACLRPAVLAAVAQAPKAPDHLYTSFAGYDFEGVEAIRKHLLPHPPSSPCVALFKDGKLAFFLERRDVEGSDAASLASVLLEAFQAHCS